MPLNFEETKQLLELKQKHKMECYSQQESIMKLEHKRFRFIEIITSTD